MAKEEVKSEEPKTEEQNKGVGIDQFELHLYKKFDSISSDFKQACAVIRSLELENARLMKALSDLTENKEQS